MTCDWTDTSYCGLTLKWDFLKKHVYISIPGYIEKPLTQLAHKKPICPVHAPHKWTKPVFVCHIQQSTSEDFSPYPPHLEVKLVQSMAGGLL